MTKSKKSWEKRLKGAPDELAIDFVESLSYDKRLYKYDIQGSIAHAQMLAEQKIITAKEAEQIRKALLEIGGRIAEGKFRFNKIHEDIHMAIEAELITKIGDTGRKLHTGRSRNDQVATDMRLWMRDEIAALQTAIVNLQKALLALAEKYSQNIMPAYTHLQRAQPISIGAYLLSFVEQFERDYIRLSNCSQLMNVSPLGCGAVAGSTLSLDRKSTSSKLGFASIARNSIDAVADRDFCAEFIFVSSLIAAHLSRLAEDFIIYQSNEFSFIKVDDKYCTSSSMMPQKRNPDMLELIRGKTGSVYGSLIAMLTILKALPSTYNRDLQEDKIHIFSAADNVGLSLRMAAAIIENTQFNTDHIAAEIDQGYPDATSLAEYLVSRGVPFRQAHGIVGSIVADCEKQNKKLAEMELDWLRKKCDKIDADVYKSLGAENVVKKYATDAAAGFKQVNKQIKFWQKRLTDR